MNKSPVREFAAVECVSPADIRSTYIGRFTYKGCLGNPSQPS